MKVINKGIVMVISLWFSYLSVHSQDSLEVKDGFSFLPTEARLVNGLAVGILNDLPRHKQVINGVTFELLGYAWLTPFMGLDDGGYYGTTKTYQTINGLSLGLAPMNDKVNGLTIAALINTAYDLNGLKVGLLNVDFHRANGLQLGLANFNVTENGLTVGLYNQSQETRGLQIGLFNRTRHLKGLQIGLINTNQSRTMILFNW